MGEREFEHAAHVEIDEAAKRISFRPDPDGVWGRHYPQAVHHLVTATPDAVEAIGSGALLFDGAAPRSADAYAAIRTGINEPLLLRACRRAERPRARRAARRQI